jgi:hypothetical protein
VEIVLRVLKGESLDELSRELAVPASRLSEWRDEFLRAGEVSMKTREPNAQDEEIRKLKETIGSIAMENEVLLGSSLLRPGYAAYRVSGAWKKVRTCAGVF